jgi:acyl transferase domain-containing protein
MSRAEMPDSPESVAIIGMAARFPGADDVERFWENLQAGVESITFLSDEDLAMEGVDPAVARLPNYVRAAAAVSEPLAFDAGFFGTPPVEAEWMDPQHRALLEYAWAALEDAGYPPNRYPGRVGVFAGSGSNTYLLSHLMSGAARPTSPAATLQAVIANEKDYLTSRVAYRLNLRGPSVTVQTACSTSLVAVHLACQSLLAGECDLALAGGVTLRFPHRSGYLHQPGLPLSPDGHCRAFDARAQGTLFGSGIGLVVLKRLPEARADGDTVRAVVRSSAVNNDGSARVGFTAPGVEGQSEVIAEAHAVAGVAPATIGYVETHGSGTPLGDTIEVAALTRAFRASTDARGFCAIGSVKTNVGHLEAAAGIAGLIKTVLMLERRAIVPSLHFEEPNPQIDFDASPFYVSRRLAEWPADGTPRRAGVSSFGMGGTNAHIVLEEAPIPDASGPSRRLPILLVSARTEPALEQATDRLAAWLRAHPSAEVADVAYTLQVGRAPFEFRRALLCREGEEAARALAERDPTRLLVGRAAPPERPVAFLFSGLGDHYAGMTRGLYETEPAFRDVVDECCERLRPALGLDLREILYPPAAAHSQASEAVPPRTAIDFRAMVAQRRPGDGEPGDPLDARGLAQPAVFVVSYALARLWLGWGVRPSALIGHSLGEYAAACLAGVFSLEDALALVAHRAKLIQGLPRGAMLAVPLSEEDVTPLLGPALSVSAVNGPALTVVGGPPDAVERFAAELTERKIHHRPLPTSHAYHSAMMEPIVDALVARVRAIELRPPEVPCISNVTGTWLGVDEATDPTYWGRHLRETVRFAAGLGVLWKGRGHLFLEVGPGQSLSSFALQHPAAAERSDRVAIPSIRPRYDRRPDDVVLVEGLARLWLAGARIDWQRLYPGERRRRLPLPTYPFERQRFSMQAGTDAVAPVAPPLPTAGAAAGCLFSPGWVPTPLPSPSAEARGPWLVLGDPEGLGAAVGARLRAAGAVVVSVGDGAGFASLGEDRFTVDPGGSDAHRQLLDGLADVGRLPAAIVDLRALGAAGDPFPSLLALLQALAGDATRPVELAIVSSRAVDVSGAEPVELAQSALLAASRVVPLEHAHVRCRSIDVDRGLGAAARDRLADRLAAELVAPCADQVVAYRGSRRWVERLEPVLLGDVPPHAEPRDGAVYVLRGAHDEPTWALAAALARMGRPKLALGAGSPFPPRAEWSAWKARTDVDDPVRCAIERLEALERAGAEVLVLPDSSLVARAEEVYGRIDAAFDTTLLGSDGHWSPVEAVSAEDGARALRLAASVVTSLDDALDGRPAARVVLTRLAPVLGGVGSIGQTISHLAVQTLVRARARESVAPWLVLSSALWEGGADGAEDEAPRALGLALARPDVVPLLFASHGLPTPRRAPDGATAPDPPSLRTSRRCYPRPQLPTPYVAPRTEAERVTAAIWQELFGIEPVGIHDNFFALGGTSLLATQLIAPLGAAFRVELPVDILLEASTVAELAAAAEAAKARTTEETMERLFARLDALSDEDVCRMLAERQSTLPDAGDADGVAVDPEPWTAERSPA